MPKSKPPYPAEFRQQIIELARAGRTPAQLSREFGPTAQSIANWIAQDGRDRGKPLPGKEGLTTAEREEVGAACYFPGMLKIFPRLLLGCFTTSALLVGLPAAAQLAGGDEVPFITSPDNVTLEMLRMADVRTTDHVIDLGSGDGRIVILAAKRFGATGLGVEIDPDLVARSLRAAKEAGVADRVQFRVEDLFTTDFSSATVITMYLLPEVNLRLRPSLLALKPGTRIVSHDWDMGDWQPDQTTVVAVPEKAIGREKSSQVHLWVVPARVHGLWCGTGLLRGSALEFSQRHQMVGGTLIYRNRSRTIEGRIQGASLSVAAGRNGELSLDVQGDELRITAARGDLLPAQGQNFKRAAERSTQCPPARRSG